MYADLRQMAQEGPKSSHKPKVDVHWMALKVHEDLGGGLIL